MFLVAPEVFDPLTVRMMLTKKSAASMSKTIPSANAFYPEIGLECLLIHFDVLLLFSKDEKGYYHKEKHINKEIRKK